MNMSQRDTFWNNVYKIAREDKDVVVVSADMGAPALDIFRQDLAHQFINVGIAEQQAILLSAGMALEGKKVYAYAIAPFITLRCFEQIKLELGAMNLAVKLVGVGAGFSYDDSGPTHHAVEDISLLRTVPYMNIHNITDNTMAAAMAGISYQSDCPCYIRLDREELPDIYDSQADFSRGICKIKSGEDLVIIGTGNMVHQALKISEALRERSVSAGVIDLHTLPINEEALLKDLGPLQRIVTLEEHTLPGGVGGAVCECLCDNGVNVGLKRFGLNFREGYCYQYGGRSNIQSHCGLDSQSVSLSILQWLNG